MKTRVSRTFFAMRMMLGVVVVSLVLIGCTPTTPPALPATSTPVPAPTTMSPTPTPVSAQTGQRKIISVWTHMLPGGIEGDVLAAIVKDFEQAQDDYTIELVPIAPEIYADRITGSARSGSLPCVLEFDLGYAYNFAWSGYLQPIDRFVSAELRAIRFN